MRTSTPGMNYSKAFPQVIRRGLALILFRKFRVFIFPCYALLICMHFSLAYMYCGQTWLNIANYIQGKERLPYQPRCLMMFVLRAADHLRSNRLEKLISVLNQTEVIIGEWHDRIILNEALDTFIKENETRHKRIFSELERVNKVVCEEAETLLIKLLPALDNVVILIAEIPFLRKAGRS